MLRLIHWLSSHVWLCLWDLKLQREAARENKSSRGHDNPLLVCPFPRLFVFLRHAAPPHRTLAPLYLVTMISSATISKELHAKVGEAETGLDVPPVALTLCMLATIAHLCYNLLSTVPLYFSYSRKQAKPLMSEIWPHAAHWLFGKGGDVFQRYKSFINVMRRTS